MSKVLVIGAGGVGSVAVHKMAMNADIFPDITLASRRKFKCDAIAESVKTRTGITIKTAEVDADHIDGPQIIGDDTLIYRRGDKLWRTTVEGCPSLSGDPLIIAEIYGSRMCRRDHFRTVTRGSTIPSGYCFFGPFTPYSRPKK